jgi:hypothetical protein
VDLAEAMQHQKRVDPEGAGVHAARGLGICMGDRYDYHRDIED